MTYLFRNNQEASNLQVELHRQDFNYNFSKDNSMMPLNTLSKRIESYDKPSFTPTFSLIHPVMQHSSQILKMNQKGWNDFQPFQLPIQDLSMRLIPSMKQTVQSSNQSYLNFQEPSLIPAFAKKDAGQNSRREEEKEQFKIKADPKANEIVRMRKGSWNKEKKNTRKVHSSTHKSCSKDHFCTWGLSEDDAYKMNTILKKKNLKFMLDLRMFNYEIRDKQTPITGRKTFEFICKHNGSCNTVFDRSWNLLDHCRMHYGIKPYQCNECGKGFTQRGNMRKHLDMHKRSRK